MVRNLLSFFCKVIDCLSYILIGMEHSKGSAVMLRKQKWPVQHRAEYDNTFSFLWYAVILGIYQSIMQIIAYCKKTLYDFISGSEMLSFPHVPRKSRISSTYTLIWLSSLI